MWDTRRIHRCWILFWRMPHSREFSWLKDNICAYMGIWRWFTECKVRVVKTHSANNALSPAVRRKGDGNWTKILNRHLRLHNQCSQCALCLQFYCSVIVVTWVHWQRMIRCYQSEEIRWRPNRTNEGACQNYSTTQSDKALIIHWWKHPLPPVGCGV